MRNRFGAITIRQSPSEKVWKLYWMGWKRTTKKRFKVHKTDSGYDLTTVATQWKWLLSSNGYSVAKATHRQWLLSGMQCYIWSLVVTAAMEAGVPLTPNTGHSYPQRWLHSPHCFSCSFHWVIPTARTTTQHTLLVEFPDLSVCHWGVDSCSTLFKPPSFNFNKNSNKYQISEWM